MIEENGIYKWKNTNKDPYKKIIPQLQILEKQYRNNKDELILDQMIKLIRSINVFPINYFSDTEIDQEIKTMMEKDNICIINNTVFTQLRNGLLLLDFLFPNLHLATTCNEKQSIYERFYDDECLKSCLRCYLNNKQPINNMRTVYFQPARFFWDTPINYSPMRARIIAERFTPKNGTIYDYSAGYGGRMLGILTSKNNYTYIGTDPNTNTYYNLKKLGEKIEKNTQRKNSYKLYNLCSEQLQLQNNTIDFVFSCPPYYQKEKYSDENTQSINKYPLYYDWLENYVRKTIQNCFKALKDNGVFCINISNYFYSGKEIPLVEDWLRICKEEGLYFKEKIPIQSRFRSKNEHGDAIYLFMKKEELELPNYTSDLLYQKANEEKKERERRGKRRYGSYTICQYDIFGNLEETFNDYSKINIDRKILNSKNLYNNKYYRVYRDDDIILTQINVKQPIAQINNIYFFNQIEIAKYFNVSKQAISQVVLKHKENYMNENIIWFKKDENK